MGNRRTFVAGGRRRLVAVLVLAAAWFGAQGAAAFAQPAAAPPAMQRSKIDPDGTIHLPPITLPLSSYLSPEARAWMIERLAPSATPAPAPAPPAGGSGIEATRARVIRDLTPLLDKQKARYPVEIVEGSVGGVPTVTIRPSGAIPAASRGRVLINLHGGGFTNCAPICGLLESVPVASLGKIEVVSVQYRQGPEHRYPAASEDVEKVYVELLKTHAPEAIGIYGCSAGGMLSASAVAWFQTRNLPRPGAVGLLCASAGSFAGDASIVANAFDGRPVRAGLPPEPNRGVIVGQPYFGDADTSDPRVQPLGHPEVLAKFPPTLLVTATRAFEFSGAVETHRQLVRAGVDADLHVFDGLYHGFFYNPDLPESRETYDVIARFFDKHLRR